MYPVRKLVYLFSLSGEIGGIYNENALYTYLKLVDSVSFADILRDQAWFHTYMQTKYSHT